MQAVAEMPMDDVKEEITILELQEQREVNDIARRRCRTDLFYLLSEWLRRPDIKNDWLKARCMEVQSEPDNVLDLWARDHYKSSIITFGLTVQDILSSHGKDPLPKWNGKQPVIGIFSHTRPMAKGFLRQIKREFEENDELKELFPDILYKDPHKDSPKWSEDDGIIVKRQGNPKESTVEAWGLVDGQPTSKHFDIKVYDDIVSKESVTTPDMIEKTTKSLELSDNLGTATSVDRYVGTRYHFNDSYRNLIDRGIKTRIYPCTENGEADGVPVLLSRELVAKKRTNQGAYTFACQMLMNPKADETQGFKTEWLKYYKDHQGGKGMNVYILCDPANEKKKTNDYTVFMVIGLSADNNYYKLEITRDRLNLTERTAELFRLHQKWNPKGVGYEKYGMQSDIQHIKSVMELDNYRFAVTELGGNMPKNDRIRRLILIYEQGRMYMMVSEHKTNYEGTTEDLVQIFINSEYKPFPVPVHDDMFDCEARILDPAMNCKFPMRQAKVLLKPRASGGWMGA